MHHDWQPGLVALVPVPGLVAVRHGWLVAHKGDALHAVYPLLDSGICRACSLRVFEQCQTVLPNGEPRQSPQLFQP